LRNHMSAVRTGF